MQKIYINKRTDIVEQIIQDSYYNFENYNRETFGDTVYLIELDNNSHLEGHNHKYNKETNNFEVIEDIQKDEEVKADIDITEIEKLKKEIEKMQEIIKGKEGVQ